MRNSFPSGDAKHLWGLRPRAGSPGPYLEAAAAGAADGGPAAVHHHNVVGAVGPRGTPGAGHGLGGDPRTR